MHSLEGVIAAVIMLAYAIQLFHSMSIQRTDWTPASSKQEMAEYLLAVKNSGFRNMPFYGKLDEFIGVSRYFLGEGRGYNAKTIGLPKIFFEVGVATNKSIEVAGAINTTPCVIKTQFRCYNAKFQGVNYTIIDYDGGTFNDTKENYDTIYFDFDNNGYYNSSEGPYFAGNLARLAGNYWTIGRINNFTGNVSFWDAGRLVDIMKNVNDTKMNGRKIKVSFRGAAFYAGISDFDAVVVPGDVDPSPYESEIHDFMQQGGGILELKNISSAGDIGQAEKDIFGLSWITNDITGTDQNGSMADISPGRQAYSARKYFLASGIFAPTGGINTTGYVTDGIPNNNSAHIGNITLRRQKYGVLVTRSSGMYYDSARIDSDRNNDFTDDAPLSVGGSIIIDGNNYTVKEIAGNGNDVVFTVDENYAFSNFLPAGTQVYPVSNSSEYVLAEAKSRAYNITSRAIGAEIHTPTSACSAGEATMPPGTHLCGMFPAGGQYNFSVTKKGANYTLLNVDMDANRAYNDPGEGPFSTGSLVGFGPESYRAFISTDGSEVVWVLEKRWPVPYAVVNYQGSGMAVWMPDALASRDEWSLFLSAVLASGGSVAEGTKGSSIGKWIDSKAVFFENNETFQPYEVSIRMWY